MTQRLAYLVCPCLVYLALVCGYGSGRPDNSSSSGTSVQYPALSGLTPAKAYQTLFTLRVAGDNALPFDPRTQEMLITKLNSTITKALGPAVFRSYKDSFFSNGSTTIGFVDLEARVWSNLWNPPGTGANTSEAIAAASQSFVAFVVQVMLELNVKLTLVGVENVPHAATASDDSVVVTRPIQLYDITFQICGRNDEVYLASEIIFQEVSDRMEYDLFQGIAMTKASYNNCSDGNSGFRFVATATMGLCTEDDLETRYHCFKDPASALRQGFTNATTWIQDVLADAGLSVHAEIQSITPVSYYNLAEVVDQAASEQLPKNSSVPWHLDRLDQRELPLDGKFTSDNVATGVNIYVISSGVLSNHSEFCISDDSGCPGSRVKALWGYQGLDPLTDCGDSNSYVGLGTYGASLAGGLQSGVAKNATFYSVRFRKGCLADEKDIWQPGGLPSALDAVISNCQKPAVVVIDTWWSTGRFEDDDDDYLLATFNDRLAKFQEKGILIVTQTGGGGFQPVCENIFSNRSNTVLVGAQSRTDFRTFDSPGNSPCIDLFAPGGDLGAGIRGASSVDSHSFVEIIPRDTGAMYVTAGVAAQYLSLHPDASPEEVKEFLVASATQDTLNSIGPESRRRSLYTDLTQSESTEAGNQAGSESSSSSSLSVGAVVGIALGSVAALVVTAILLVVLYYKRRSVKRTREASDIIHMASSCHGKPMASADSDALLTSRSEAADVLADAGIQHNSNSLDPAISMRSARTAISFTSDTSWKIDQEDVELVKNPDGSAVLLGAGNFGAVYKAVKGGVQMVAMKVIHPQKCSPDQIEAFKQEIDLMRKVSHDRNIVQFYGAIDQTERLALVAELMEGGDLRNALTSDTTDQLRWYNRGKDIALDIARGLCHLHSQSVAHRDLKSKNVMLTRDGTAKIGDVGMAKIMSDNYATADNNIGTFAWAAPELIMGCRSSLKADIFSLGVVIWEIVTQEVPVRGGMRDMEVPRECPEEVVKLYQACMAPEPKDRPSAKEVYDWLLRCPPLESQPHEATYRHLGRNLSGQLGGLPDDIRQRVETGRLLVFKAPDDWDDNLQDGEEALYGPEVTCSVRSDLYTSAMVIHEEPEGTMQPHAEYRKEPEGTMQPHAEDERNSAEADGAMCSTRSNCADGTEAGGRVRVEGSVEAVASDGDGDGASGEHHMAVDQATGGCRAQTEEKEERLQPQEEEQGLRAAAVSSSAMEEDAKGQVVHQEVEVAIEGASNVVVIEGASNVLATEGASNVVVVVKNIEEEGRLG